MGPHRGSRGAKKNKNKKGAEASVVAEGPTTVGPDNTLDLNHTRCKMMPYGVKFTNLTTRAVARRCCCAGNAGQDFRLTVAIDRFKEFRWRNDLNNPLKAQTKEVIDKVTMEIKTMLYTLFGMETFTEIK